MHLQEFLRGVTELGQEDGPFLSMSLDLSPTADGRPSAPTLLRSAWGGVHERSAESADLFAGVISDTADLVDASLADGAKGIFMVTSAGELGRPWLLSLPIPVRNDLRIAEFPWLLELERTAYLSARPVVSTSVSREGIDIMRVVFSEVDVTAEEPFPTHVLQKVHGRTDAENIVGAPGDFGGGHAWNKLENIVEEHRAAAAREGAAKLAEITQPGDLVVVAGPPEPRADLVNALPDSFPEVVQEHESNFGENRERLEWSTKIAAEAQFESADAVARGVLEGAYGEQSARGPEAIDVMFDQGRVNQLVVHESAISHWGMADDARYIEAPWDGDDWYGKAMQRARDTSADVIFCSVPELMSEELGAVATLRW